MLNAFRHLMKDHYGVGVPDVFVLDVLNAFRHLMKDHTLQDAQAAADQSAQRLSASDEGSRWDFAQDIVWEKVLNAFRHLMKDHTNGDSGKQFAPEVLNAFRHLMKDHETLPAALGSGACAQRLSASDEGSRGGKIVIAYDQGCSTPFGI